ARSSVSSSLLKGYDEPENLLSSIQTFVPQALIRDRFTVAVFLIMAGHADHRKGDDFMRQNLLTRN
ncbi:hypothetical protein, partial [Salmonella enterica]|uniref:hypothetical protein n=1 Tax=Salmonella enterica TaxID=28901 RepID=UPI003524C271